MFTLNRLPPSLLHRSPKARPLHTLTFSPPSCIRRTTRTSPLRSSCSSNFRRHQRSAHTSSGPTLPTSDAQKSTIYALSTPPGRGGVGIIRISGPDALQVWRKMRPPPTPTPTFPTLRPAAPGEFTRRAFLGGRLDLTQVEGLKDLIDAETEGQRRLAVRAAEGEVRAQLSNLRKDVVHALAQVEALIDFGEGEEIEEGVFEGAREGVQKVLETVRGYLDDHRRGELLRSGIKLAIFGPPNAGKSSLLNFLAQREAAIVTPIPGTTRDILSLSLDIGGLPVIISDTAGLRKTEDVVEKIGIERARQAVQNADISICVLSLADILSPPSPSSTDTDHWRTLVSPATFFLLNKSDLLLLSPTSSLDPERLLKSLLPPSPVSARQGTESTDPQKAWIASLSSGTGTQAFLNGFAAALNARYGLSATADDAGRATELNPVVITRARHRDHLKAAQGHLEVFLEYGPNDVVLAAEELRYAARAIGKVTGAIDVEDILDAVFRDFCIGK
ncbi:tRNA modification GTPase GTPBP3 [Ephemerocybe angulata]|uniref:tRNA modification GTPase GTPBP3 n=1 Tax=Ephemerocybe angulata TaxID=980116 RepID=A0A8H6MFN2_9AGAR|nr:tRNA modification GTPase GTPBP3 [Tulosesus angulatus]